MSVLTWKGPRATDNTVTFLPQNWLTDPDDLTRGLPYTEGSKIVNGGSFRDGNLSRFNPLAHLRRWVPWLEGTGPRFVVADWEYTLHWEHAGPWWEKFVDATTTFFGGGPLTILTYDPGCNGLSCKLADGCALSMNGSDNLTLLREWQMLDGKAWPCVVPTFHPCEYDDAQLRRGMRWSRMAWPEMTTCITWTWPRNDVEMAIAQERTDAAKRIWESLD